MYICPDPGKKKDITPARSGRFPESLRSRPQCGHVLAS
jgi:hypothetical protein